MIQYLQIAQLSGWLAKSLVVPTGFVGAVIDGHQLVRTLTPGHHVVINRLQRLFCEAGDWRFALLPTAPQPLYVPIQRLRAGDGTWVDLGLALMVRVADPARATTALTGGESLATELSVALDGAARGAVERWEADDLDRTQAAEGLAQLLGPLLEAQLRERGLASEGLISLTTRPSDEVVEVARKMAEVDAALAEVEMGRWMEALTAKAEWLQFAEQVEADFDLPEGTLATMLEDLGDSVTAAQVRARVAAAAGGDEGAALAARVRRLAGEVQAPPPPPLAWWDAAILWFKLAAAGVLLVGLLLVAVAPFVRDLSTTAAGIWLAVLAVVAAGLMGLGFWLDRRSVAAHQARLAPVPLLERLGRGERRRIDLLVREQLARELGALSTRMREAQNLAYREGYREEALRIKDVQASADRARRAVQAESHGAAAYLAQAQITRRQLDTMLRYDEELLARSVQLGDLGEQVRRAVLAEDLSSGAYIRELQGALSALDHQIQARARFIQAPMPVDG